MSALRKRTLIESVGMSSLCHKPDISARRADGLSFEFELFDLPYSAPDPRLGHWRLDGVLRGGAYGWVIPTFCADS